MMTGRFFPIIGILASAFFQSLEFYAGRGRMIIPMPLKAAVTMDGMEWRKL